MNKSEIIFIIILIVAYIVSATFLNIPLHIHLLFGVAIAFALIFVLLLKLQHDFENEKINRIFKVLTNALFVCFMLSLCYNSTFNEDFIIKPGVFAILFLISLAVMFISGKNSENEI